MDKSDVQEIVNDNVKWLRWALQLQEWSITFVYESLPDGIGGECRPNLPYKMATITIDPDKADNKADVLKTLLHELLHILLSPFENYRESVMQIADGKQMENVLDTVYYRIHENVVYMLERMFRDGLGFDVKKLITRTKRNVKNNEE